VIPAIPAAGENYRPPALAQWGQIQGGGGAMGDAQQRPGVRKVQFAIVNMS
jgi:hypothetical protein